MLPKFANKTTKAKNLAERLNFDSDIELQS